MVMILDYASLDSFNDTAVSVMRKREGVLSAKEYRRADIRDRKLYRCVAYATQQSVKFIVEWTLLIVGAMIDSLFVLKSKKQYF